MKLHRSLTFWSGLLVIAALIWAWRDSMRYGSSAWTERAGRILIANAYAGIQVIHEGAPLSSPYGAGRREFAGDPIVVLFGALPPPVLVRKGELTHERNREFSARFTTAADRPVYSLREWFEFISVGGMNLLIPHWLILSVFTSLWLALLGWRARRRKKALTTQRPAP